MTRYWRFGFLAAVLGTAVIATAGGPTPQPLENGQIPGVTVSGRSVTIDPEDWTFVPRGNELVLSGKKKPKPETEPHLRCVCESGSSAACIMSGTGTTRTCGGASCCAFEVVWVDKEVVAPVGGRASGR